MLLEPAARHSSGQKSVWDRKAGPVQEEEPCNLFIRVALNHTSFSHHSCLFQHDSSCKLKANQFSWCFPTSTNVSTCCVCSISGCSALSALVCSGHTAEENSAQAAFSGWVSNILIVVVKAASALGCKTAALLLGIATALWLRRWKIFQCQTWSTWGCQTAGFILSGCLREGTHFKCSCLQVSQSQEDIIPF